MGNRGEGGKFVESEDSLHPKQIGLRLHRPQYVQFFELAKSAGVLPTVLARQIVENYLRDMQCEQGLGGDKNV